MTTTDASSNLPANITAGDVLVALSAAPKKAGDATWIKIAPRGEIVTRNGVTYSFDPETLAARFASDDVKIAIDIDHSIARLASQGIRADAVGWIEELQPREDGLYGRVEWLEAGKAALAARSHRYISPTFHHDDSGAATWMHSVALVAAPALSRMPALASADPARKHTETSMTDKIATALGLAANAGEAACLSAIATLKTGSATPPDGYVTKAVHEQTLATLSATTSELDGIKKATRQKKVDEIIEGALKAKKIVPAQKEHFASLCASDAGLEQVTALLAATPAGLGLSGLDGKTVDPGAAEDAVINPAALGAEARAYLNAQNAAGNPITYMDAFTHVEAAAKTKKVATA